MKTMHVRVTIPFMAGDEDIRALARLALRQKALLELSFDIISDLIVLTVPNLERCHHNACKEPATVKHVDLNINMCDAHAAATIVHAKTNIKNVESDMLDFAQQSLAQNTCLANEDTWIDLPNAERVRRLKDYVDFIIKNDEVLPTSRIELH